MTALRWLDEPPLDGPANMARDEALLQRVGQGRSPPTLRFYRWREPTVSLGYFQSFAEYALLPPPLADLPVVRRQTGGGAILHDLELTYALVLPAGHPLVGAGGPRRLYDHVHGAFAHLLAGLGVPVRSGTNCPGRCAHDGPFFCFERHSPYDLLADGRKLMGSAQRRTAAGVLQHGSLILDSRFPQQRCATLAEYGVTAFEDHLAALVRLIGGQDPGPAGSLQPDELELAGSLRRKYASDGWTRRK